MNKKQWFSGYLDGQYVGRPKGRNASATHQAGEVFEIEITRAAITQIVLGPLECGRDKDDSEGTNEATIEETGVLHHHKALEGSFHQSNIAQVFFLEAMGPGKTVRSGAHDVLVSEVQLSDAARKDGKTYGRIRGTVSGWFRPLPTPLPAVEVIAPARPGEVWQSELLISIPSVNEELPTDSTTLTLNSNISEDSASVTSSKSVFIADDAAKVPTSDTAYAESDLPFFTIGSVLALGMFVVAGWFAALTWYAGFLPAVGLRRWLYGIIPEGWFTRGFALFAMALQLIVATVLIAGWQEAGCKTLHPFVLAFLLCGQYLCCLLPRAAGFAITAGALAAVIAQFYGPLGSICP